MQMSASLIPFCALFMLGEKNILRNLVADELGVVVTDCQGGRKHQLGQRHYEWQPTKIVKQGDEV